MMSRSLCLSLLLIALVRVSKSAPIDRIGLIQLPDVLRQNDSSSGVLQIEDVIQSSVSTEAPQQGERAAYIDDLREQFPQCPLACEVGWPADGWCDVECSGDECGNDQGDCEGWCAPDCKPEWKDDGFCDLDCYRKECDFDGKDCEGKYGDNVVIPAPAHDDFDYKDCKCDQTLLNNEECDQDCMNPECNWDGRDCLHQCNALCATMWLGDGECDDDCNTEECFFDKGDCGECAPGCLNERLGNGLCDASCNVEECEFDRGDCDGVCHTWEFQYDVPVFEYPHCRNETIGDGHCDCYCLTENCSYDGGDCMDEDCAYAFKNIPEGDKALLAFNAWQTVRRQNSLVFAAALTQTDADTAAEAHTDTDAISNQGMQSTERRRRRRRSGRDA